jgi:hypothetical protein
MAQTHASAMHAHHTEELRQNAESDRQLMGHVADLAQTAMQPEPESPNQGSEQ